MQDGKLRACCCPGICRQGLGQARLLHRGRRTHREPLGVQQDFEVTKLIIKRRETDAMIQ